VKIVSFGEKSVSYYEEENVGENSCMQHDKWTEPYAEWPRFPVGGKPGIIGDL
jgi:hypothetical protein